ncbi:MAG: SPFH/Band 7/PHB domain protein [Firmicutes bacterium]|nr:SPFH/Band 7/PHB domain protein [Bacillota bacterium]
MTEMVTQVVETIVAVVVVVGILRGIFRVVPQGSLGLVQRLGKFRREASPGLVMKVPLIDTLQLVSTKSVTINLDPEPVITADNVSPVIDAYFIYQVVDAKNFTFEIQNPELAIKNIVSATLRSEVGQRKLADVMIHREQINAKLRIDLDEATGNWGIRIVQASIRQVDLPKEMQQAMEAQKKADANKLASIEQAQGAKESAILGAEGAKQAAIAQAQGEQQAIVLKAEAARQARVLQAEGEALAIEKLAEAQAEAVRLVNQAVLKLAEDGASGWNQEKIRAVLQLKSLETLGAIGQSPSTKIVLPAELQGLAGIVTAIQGLKD